MTGGITIDISEFNVLLKKFKELPERILDEVDAEIHESVRIYAGLAKNKLASQLSANNNKKTSRLLGSINFVPTGQRLGYEVFAQTTYAAYQEWGTINYVSVPPDLVEIAAKYKGRGIRKTGGVKPKHYFFSQRALVIPELMKNINNVLSQELNK